MDSIGQTRQVTVAEAPLNWQAENACVQNGVLKKISESQSAMTNIVIVLESMVTEIKEKIDTLHHELLHVVNTNKDFTTASQVIAQKESEKRHLEAQLRDLEKQPKFQESPPFYRQSVPDLWSIVPKPVFKPLCQPQPL